MIIFGVRVFFFMRYEDAMNWVTLGKGRTRGSTTLCWALMGMFFLFFFISPPNHDGFVVVIFFLPTFLINFGGYIRGISILMIMKKLPN